MRKGVVDSRKWTSSSSESDRQSEWKEFDDDFFLEVSKKLDEKGIENIIVITLNYGPLWR